jgi:Sec-independent protein translocase protein TatA
MDFLGIGPLELAFLFLIILIVLGPQDMIKTGRVIGRYLRRLMTSSTWRLVQDTSREIRNLPNRLAREAGLEELEQDIRQTTDLPELDEFKNMIGGEIELDAWTQPAPDRGAQEPTPPKDADAAESPEAPAADDPDPAASISAAEPDRPSPDSEQGKQ